MLYLKRRLGMPFRIRRYNVSLRQKLHHGITWLSTNTQPILYPVYTPFDALMRVIGFDLRSVNAQKFDRFRIPSFSLVDGDEVKDSVVSDAVYGESQADGHDGRIDLVWSHVVEARSKYSRAGISSTVGWNRAGSKKQKIQWH